MPTRKFTVSFDVTEEEFGNFMTRLAGGSVLEGEIPRNTTVAVAGDETEDGVAADPNATTDKFGVTYDPRFHAKTKNFTQDGKWKRAKGLSDADKAAADAYEASFTAAAPAALPVAAAPAALPVAEPVAAVGMPGLPGAPAAALPLPVAAVAPPPVSYEDVVAVFGQAVGKDPTVSARYMDIYASAGVTNPDDLKTNETLRRALVEKLQAIVNS